MRGKYKRLRESKENRSIPGSNKKTTIFNPGLMKYDGQGKFTFYKVKPWTIFKFVWSIFLHGKPGPRKNKRIW